MQTRTKRQRDILEFIEHFIDGHGYEPSYQMIARHFGLSSKAGIARHIYALERQGALIRRRIGGSFQLELTPTRSDPSASLDIEWLEINDTDNVIGRSREPISVPGFMLGDRASGDFFAFEVADNALAERGILENDIAIIEKRGHARDGDCVLAEAGDAGFVLRVYYRHGSEIELRPQNPDFPSIFVSSDITAVRGLFRGLLRSYFTP